MYQRYDNELKQRIGGLGIGQSVLATKSPRTSRLRLAGYAAVAAALVAGALFWSAHGRARPLARALPAATPFYASADLGAGSYWYDRALLWKRTALPTDPVRDLVSRIDVLSWDNRPFKEVQSLFSGTLEFAELKSGELVLAGTLAEAETWAAVSGVSEPQEGAIYPGVGPAGGLWARKSPEWVWFMRDGRLYIATSASVASELGAEPTAPLAQTLSAPPKGSMGTIAVSRENQGVIASHPAIRLLLQGADLPGVLDFYYSPGKITFSSQRAAQKSGRTDLSSASASPLYALYGQFSGDVAVYAADAGSLQGAWFSGLSGNLQDGVRSVEELLGAFYHIDTQSLLSALAGSELVFLLRYPETGAPSKPSWIVLVSESVPEDLVGPIAETLFAVAHPLAKEIPLADGTSMVELRADIGDFLWEQVSAPYEGREFPLKELRGAGEPRGLATGVIPGLGRVLTNDMSLLSGTRASAGIGSCSLGGPSTGSVRLSGGFLSNIFPALQPVTSITITESPEFGIFGCAQLAGE